MTLFNYWHYGVLGIVFIMFIIGVISAFKQPKAKLVVPMLISVTLVSALLASFAVVTVDKYTKKVKLYRLKNKRLLSIEKIVYTGIVKNEGSFPIGKVTFEIKILNKGHATGNVKGGSFFKASGFINFFTGGSEVRYKPQSITKEFIVARNLKPGEAKTFRVYFDYPPHFRSVSYFADVWGH